MRLFSFLETDYPSKYMPIMRLEEHEQKSRNFYSTAAITIHHFTLNPSRLARTARWNGPKMPTPSRRSNYGPADPSAYQKATRYKTPIRQDGNAGGADYQRPRNPKCRWTNSVADKGVKRVDDTPARIPFMTTEFF